MTRPSRPILPFRKVNRHKPKDKYRTCIPLESSKARSRRLQRHPGTHPHRMGRSHHDHAAGQKRSEPGLVMVGGHNADRVCSFRFSHRHLTPGANWSYVQYEPEDGYVANMRSAVDITGDDIDTWSRKTSALAELPVLVRRLLLATADPDQIDFPGDGGTRLGGWDGIATTNRSSTYCPAGSSGWEVTVEKRKGKLDGDFKKRVGGAQVAGQPGVSAYVAVTARRYGKKREWVQEKIKSGPWADVHLWDADDLATWLGIAPAVYAWFSRKIGHPLGELLGPDEFRSRWSNRTRPPLPSRLVLAGKVRRDSAEQLRKCLRTGPGAVTCVQADTREEAALFVAEALCEKGVEEASARVLLVESSDAWNWAATAQAPRPQVLVPTFAGFDLGSAAGINAAVVVPFGRP